MNMMDALLYIFDFGLPNKLIRRPGSPLIRMLGLPLFPLWIPLWAASLFIIMAGGGIAYCADVWRGDIRR